MGKHVDRLLKYAIKFPYWNAISGKDRATNDAIRTLVRKGLIVVNDFNQFRIAIPNSCADAIDNLDLFPQAGDFIRLDQEHHTLVASDEGEDWSPVYCGEVLIKGLFNVISRVDDITIQKHVVARNMLEDNEQRKAWVKYA